nr:hypothetical protein [Tanacetum cinerariifolium]
MLAPGNYVQWKSRIKRYIDTKPNPELIHYCLKNPPYKFTWADKQVLISEGSPVTGTETYMETYKNVSQDIHDQLNAEVEAVQIILTKIDNDIYSTVDACPNACEMWKAIERLKQGESINVQDLETNLYWEFGKFTSHDEWQRFVTLVKLSQEMKTISYHKLYDILKQHQNEVNEIRAGRIARVANPLALVAQQQPNRGKEIVNSPQPIYDQGPSMVAEDDETSKDKEIDKLMALIHYCLIKSTNLPTTTFKLHQTPVEQIMIILQGLTEAQDAADSGPIFDAEPLQKVSNDDHYNVFTIESDHPEQSESIHDTYPIEQKEHNVIIDSLDMSYDKEQIDQNDDDVDLVNERELLASLIEKLKCEINDSKNRNKFLETSNKVLVEKLKGEIEHFKNKILESSNNCFKEANNKLFETNNLLYNDFKKSQAELARRNVVEYASKVEIDCARARGHLISYKMESQKSFNKYTQTINDLNQTISKLKNKLFAHQETISILSQQKVAQIKLYKTREDNDLDKVIALEKKSSVISRTKMTIVVPVSTKEPKRTVKHSVAKPIRKTFTPSGYKWAPKSEKENVNLNVSMPLGSVSRTANILEPMTSRRFTVSNTPLSSNSLAARRDCPIHRRLLVLKAHDGKFQAFVEKFLWER